MFLGFSRFIVQLSINAAHIAWMGLVVYFPYFLMVSIVWLRCMALEMVGSGFILVCRHICFDLVLSNSRPIWTVMVCLLVLVVGCVSPITLLFGMDTF